MSKRREATYSAEYVYAALVDTSASDLESVTRNLTKVVQIQITI